MVAKIAAIINTGAARTPSIKRVAKVRPAGGNQTLAWWIYSTRILINHTANQLMIN